MRLDETVRRCVLVGSLLVAMGAMIPELAVAQPSEAQEQPAHYVATWGVGAPLRLARNVDFDQNEIAPLYTDLFLGYALSAPIRLRHGAGLGAALNLTEEGGFTEPVGVAEQLVLMPAYFLFYDLTPDWMGMAHAGLPVLLTGGTSFGVEVAGGIAYRLRAGFGFYAEAGVDMFPGAEKTFHPTLSLELGIVADYEVLP
jgi:hypothetical protein